MVLKVFNIVYHLSTFDGKVCYFFFAADPTQSSKSVKSPASRKITGNEEEWKTMMLNAISERDQSEKEKSVCFLWANTCFRSATQKQSHGEVL